ncbi:Trp biosynthesis-associated membrane protein [Pseudonocardia sp. TRM90224]|uniref:Trp biosynthesis-associated membrane protein n=1 Tax=Pseudonocardia sp. TRM90224 TaxID=2812678 RepID=UPI001E5D1EA4|nr:Trp biosynthesis-associated membrane protein [Pseudonocardia sp. TRM90224]
MTPGRLLVAACAGLAASAGVLWGASAAAWPAGANGSGLTGPALLALAGVAGVVAASGVVRRGLGVLLGLVGVLAAGVGVAGAGAAPGPWLAVGGGALLVVTGTFVMLREAALARFGARYSAAGSQAAQRDPDRAAWQDLDAGRDPTAGPTGDPR